MTLNFKYPDLHYSLTVPLTIIYNLHIYNLLFKYLNIFILKTSFFYSASILSSI